MSLILDALQRSQEERQQGGRAPGVAARHYPRDDLDRRGWLRRLPWIGLTLALAAVAWLLLERVAPEAVAPGAVSPEAVVPEAVVPEAVVPEAVVPEAVVPDAVVPDAVAPYSGRSASVAGTAEAPAAAAANTGNAAAFGGSAGPAAPPPSRATTGPAAGQVATTSPAGSAPQVRQADSSAARVGGRSETARRLAPGADGAGSDAVAALYESARAQSVTTAPASPRTAAAPASPPASASAAPRPKSAEPEALDIKRLVQAAQAELEFAQEQAQPVQEHSAPFIAELSQAGKDAIPTLIYSGHDYAGGPESAVMINNKRLRVGGSAGAGVKVEEILENSVVLSHRGTLFRLRALNSWVNL